MAVSQYPRAQWISYRVTVYPPGTTARERHVMQAYRYWPLVGGLAASVLALALAATWPMALVLPAMTAVYVAGIWATYRLSAPVRHASVMLQTGFVQQGGQVETLGDGVLVLRTLKIFDDLDEQLASGQVNAAEYELGWAAVFDSLALSRPPADRGQGSRGARDAAHR